MSLEQTVDNLEIRYANAVTFVGTSNTMIDTTTGRIQTKGIQHNSNVITDVSGPHGRVAPTLKKYPEIVFEDTSKMDMGEGGTDGGLIFKQAGYTITASSTHPTNGRVPYRAFNGDHTSGWICASSSWNSGTDVYQGGRGIGGYDGEWIKLELPHKIKVETMYIEADLHSGRRPLTGKLLGSDDDSSWAIIKDLTSIPNQNKNTLNIGSTVAYKYIAFLTETIPSGNDTVWIDEIEYYGYEEYTPAGDHSVDTTFMSRFNNPQLTGVQVLVDGATGQGTNQISGGPDPSGNQSTYVTDGKYWTLNGTLTSNLSVEANTFLEGDQPHAVSVWFNSSNLEANVSNTCVFSISDQEKLDSVNLDLQSNTWHNLTYAYQGEGGSRVTYLDGRKVAEDQAEDTFGDYPPFAMTGYSQGGYVVSASNELSSSYPVWKAFDDSLATSNDTWVTGSYYSGGTPSTHDGSETTTYNGTSTVNGEWIQLELPHKIKLSYYSLKPQIEGANDIYNERMPGTGKILGSNDGINWYLIHDHSLALSDYTRGSYTNVSINTSTNTKAYKYIRFVIETTAGTETIAGIGDMKLYGHRENDLVRLPDPTNVLKYPHIAMTGPAQRGYVASASSTHYDTEAWKVFPPNSNGVLYWAAGFGLYSTTSGVEGGVYNTTDASAKRLSTTTDFGEWLKLELPHKIILSSVYISARNLHTFKAPSNFKIYGSNNDSDWYTLLTVTGATPSHPGGNYYPGGSDSGTSTRSSDVTPYKYLAIVVSKAAGGSDIGDGSGSPDTIDAMMIAQMEFYGTGVDSIPIQIGGGNIDKVANFRVYDKFVGEDQALEIWDAQKDEFGRAKSSMTLQKGRLGIGTTEPQGRLAVLDEPHNLEEFPPRAMTGYETYMEGHGMFKASASVDFGSTNYRSWNAFDKLNTSWNGGWTTHSFTWDVSGSILPDTSNVVTFDGVQCHWVALELPYAVKPDQVTLLARVDGSVPTEVPGKGRIYGSKDGVTWDQIRAYNIRDEVSTLNTLMGNTPISIPLTTINYYKHLLLTVEERYGGSVGAPSWTSIGQLRYFGTREQGQSVLHDGQLTLTKSLNVPRIGPALDADDTPRRDRLVVEYNTSTNPTFEGAVRDTSGRGLDGVFYGEAVYDATEKAITLSDGTDDYVESGKTIFARGTPQHTFSFWLKPSTEDHNDTATHYLVIWGSETSQNKWSGVALTNDGALTHVYHSSGKRTTDKVLPSPGVWYHVAVVVNSTSATTAANRDVDFYINGELYTGTYNTFGSNNTNSAYYLDWGSGTFTSVRLGSLHAASEDSSSSLSTIKLYDTALAAEEVKTLYDMGRNGSVANPQPLHITAPLYLPSTTFPNYKFYEEGKFVPVFGAVNAPTYTEQIGRYTKIGNVVFVHIMITYSGLNTSDTSGVHIGGIPFHTDGTDTNCALVSYHGGYHNMFSAVNGAGARVDGDILLLTHSSDGNYVNYNECIAAGRVNMVAQYFLP